MTFGPTVALDVNIASLALDLLHALKRPRPYTYPVWLAEMTLLHAHLRQGRGGLALDPAFRYASLQVQRFVSESLGCALCVSAFRDRFSRNELRLLNLDRLAPADKWLAPAGGPRPDLAFQVVPGSWVAAEARARSRPAPVNVSSAQRRRLTELEKWAISLRAPAGSNVTKWFMSWTWTDERRTVVDYFDPGEPTPFVNDNAADTVWRTTEALIFETAPQETHRLGPLTPRGRWQEIPRLSPAREPGWLFLGVLETPGDRHSFEWETQDGPMASAVVARTVCVTAIGMAEPPSDREVALGPDATAR